MALLRLSRAVDSLARAGTSEAGLTPAQAAVLEFAARTRPDMATVGYLARTLGVSHPSAVGIVAPLCERGLVERVADPADARRTLLRITASGRAALRSLDRYGSALAAVLDELDTRSREALVRGLGALLHGLTVAGHLVVAEPCAGCVHFRPNNRPGSGAPHFCELIQRHLTDAESRKACPEHTPRTVRARAGVRSPQKAPSRR